MTALMVALVFLMGVFVVVLGRLGVATVTQAQARTAADAAALAGAAEGRDAATAIAEANGAKLVDFERQGLDTRVTVALGRAHATARARVAPSESKRGAAERSVRPGVAATGRRQEA